MLRKVFIGAALLCCLSFTSSAQRAVSGARYIGVEARGGRTDNIFYGGAVSFGGYTLNGKWEVGVMGAYYKHDTTLDDLKLSYYDAAAFAERLFRLVSTRSRSFSTYIGAGLFMGMQGRNKNSFPESVQIDISSTAFLYGCYPKLDFEFYIGRGLALNISGGMLVEFDCDTGWIKPYIGLGFRKSLFN